MGQLSKRPILSRIVAIPQDRSIPLGHPDNLIAIASARTTNQAISFFIRPQLPFSNLHFGTHKFGWLQGTRKLLGQNSFWLRRPDTYRIHNSLAFHFAVSSSMELYKP